MRTGIGQEGKNPPMLSTCHLWQPGHPSPTPGPFSDHMPIKQIDVFCGWALSKATLDWHPWGSKFPWICQTLKYHRCSHTPLTPTTAMCLLSSTLPAGEQDHSLASCCFAIPQLAAPRFYILYTNIFSFAIFCRYIRLYSIPLNKRRHWATAHPSWEQGFPVD